MISKLEEEQERHAPIKERLLVLRAVPNLEPVSDNPLIVALYGGPGTGKSTTSALVFGALKQRGYNVELVHEVAKDFTWEKRWQTLTNQPYVAAKQLRNYDRCYGQVQAIITDTSPLLSLIYMQEDAQPPEVQLAFRNWLIADWLSRRTLNVFLTRNEARPYNPEGRSQSEEEAVALDRRIRGLLVSLEVPTMDVRMDTGDDHVAEIVEEVERCLRR